MSQSLRKLNESCKRSPLAFCAAVMCVVLMSGCSSIDLSKPAQHALSLNGPLKIWAVNHQHELVSFTVDAPGKLISSKALQGLETGEVIVGLDFRVAKGQLYALSNVGRLYTIDTSTAQLAAVNQKPIWDAPKSGRFGFDFNPTVDRIRVVHESGLNLRLHPDTGAQIDGDASADGVQPDAALAYVDTDVAVGQVPKVAAAAYTYNQQNAKITTNFALDLAKGTLVTQGTREGVQPSVSPNSGKLWTVGSLGVGQLVQASFDISDVKNEAFVALATKQDMRTRLFKIDLNSGRAAEVGQVLDGLSLKGIAIEP